MEVVRLLLEKGADIESKASNGDTTVFNAVKRGHAGVVRLLRNRGADIESATRNGNTALFNAAGERHVTVVRLLLQKGANIESKNWFSETALSNAVREGTIKCPRYCETREPGSTRTHMEGLFYVTREARCCDSGTITAEC